MRFSSETIQRTPFSTRLALIAPVALAALLTACGQSGFTGDPNAPFDLESAAKNADGSGAASTGSSAPADQLTGTFDGMSPADFGNVSQAALESEFRTTFDWAAAPTELSVAEEPDGGKSLRQRYVPTGSGSEVVSFPVSIKGGDEVWLSYRMMFEDGWQWVQGGKLPGLAGGTYPTGGAYDDNGFSARLMWRKDGQLSIYAYHHDRPEKWGEDFFLTNEDGSRYVAPIGKWITVRERIIMNSSPEAKDGEVEVWIDGERKLLKTGLRWRKNPSYSADKFLYASFYGGSDSSWAPTTTTYARFDDFKVASSSSGVD